MVKSSRFPPGGSEKPRWHVRVATRWHLLESSQAAVHTSPNSQEAEFGASVSKQSTSWVPHRRDSPPSQLAPWPCLKGYPGMKAKRENWSENLPWGDPLSPKALGPRELQHTKLVIIAIEQSQLFPKDPSVPPKGQVNCFEDNILVWRKLKSNLHPAKAVLTISVIWDTLCYLASFLKLASRNCKT